MTITGTLTTTPNTVLFQSLPGKRWKINRIAVVNNSGAARTATIKTTIFGTTSEVFPAPSLDVQEVLEELSGIYLGPGGSITGSASVADVDFYIQGESL